MYLPGKVLLALVLCACTLLAEDKKEKKEEKKPEPPKVALAIPFALTVGNTNLIVVRGQNLTNVSEARFTNAAFKAQIKSKGKAEIPKEMDAKKVGDTQVELEVVLPADVALGTNALLLVSAEGESQPFPLLVVSNAANEKEPNGSFRESQALEKKTVTGVIKEAKEVDVFKVQCKAGQLLTAEVISSSFGSTLDPIITLYDHRGHFLATHDDTPSGTEALLKTKIPADGTYHLSIQDAHDKGGPTYVYLLAVKAE